MTASLAPSPRRRHWFLGPLSSAAFLISLVLLLLSGWAVEQQFSLIQRQREGLTRALTSRAATNELDARLDDAQSGMLAYVLTGNPHLLSADQEAQTAVPTVLAQLHRLCDGDAGQHAALVALEPEAFRELQDLESLVHTRQTAGTAAVRQQVDRWLAQRVNRRVDDAITHLEAQEEATRVRSLAGIDTAARHTREGLTLLILFTCLMLAGAAFLVNQSLARRFAAELDLAKQATLLQQARDTLETRVRERTAELEREVVEHQQTEAALQASDALFRDFMAHNPALAFVRDAQLRLVFANVAYEQFFGRPLTELAGASLGGIVPPETAQRLEQDYEQVITEQQPLQVQHVIPDPGGLPHDFLFHLFPIRSQSGESLLGGLAVDISGQRRLETQLRQAQKMEVVGQLAGGIAHDFNNLITIISGYSDLALRKLKDDPATGRLVEEIQKAGDRAAALTRQLLAFSRQQVLAPRIVDLNALLHELDRMLGRLIGEDIRLTTIPAPDLHPVRADPSQIEQILLNLAVNARDAMPEGGQLTVETANVALDEAYARRTPEARAGEFVLLSVTDTGCGMDAATLAQVFEPFFTTKAPGKGTGLGLATVFGIVKQSSGHITAYSEVGQGTTFRIYLPAVQAEKPEVILAAPREPVAGHGETILLVEDEAALRALTRQALEEHGYLVLEARHGREALEMARTHGGPIHLLVTDVVMPELGGRPLAEQLPLLHHGLRVLFMSGYTTDTVVRHGVLEAGIAFLQKPFTVEALTRKVREALD